VAGAALRFGDAMIIGLGERHQSMSLVTCQISISLDGFVAGPNQSLENPLGEGGLRLHEWVFATASWHARQGETGGARSVDSQVVDEVGKNVGAYILGRNMFSPGRGQWDESWKGWWGNDPPYHVPVFVLTHYPRAPLPMQGGTTFNFVTDGIESALEQARAAAGGKNIEVPGGARTVQQVIAAGQLDELYLHIVPIVLGAGERLLENVGDPTLKPIEVIASPAVTHIKYRVLR
jgi:dihydrofolate reductase